MSRTELIRSFALAHAMLLFINGLWALFDPRSWHSFMMSTDGEQTSFTLPVIFLFAAAAIGMAWHRGIVDVPLRVVAIGTSAGILLTIILSSDLDELALTAYVHGVFHLLLIGAWVYSLLTSDSPYRPKPIEALKKVREHH